MNGELYQKIALLLRYPLAACGIYLFLRALYMSLMDGVNAAKLRADRFGGGAIATLTFLPAGSEGGKKTVTIGREGSAGSSRRCDARVTGMGLRFTHFDYTVRGGCLYIEPRFGCRVTVIGKKKAKGEAEQSGPIVLKNGERALVGKANMRFEMMRRSKKPVSPGNLKAYKSKG